MFFMPAGTINS